MNPSSEEIYQSINNSLRLIKNNIRTEICDFENQKGYYLRNRNTGGGVYFVFIEIRGNAHAAAIHLRTIDQFLKLVYLRKE